MNTGLYISIGVCGFCVIPYNNRIQFYFFLKTAIGFNLRKRSDRKEDKAKKQDCPCGNFFWVIFFHDGLFLINDLFTKAKLEAAKEVGGIGAGSLSKISKQD